MAEIELVIGNIANALWGDWLLFALLGLGMLYTVMTGGIQLRCLFLLRRGIFRKSHFKKQGEEGCSSWQSLCGSLASCVGSGNIVGVSTAILSGGDGALFWMWFAAFFGMATKFGEIVLGMCYHGHDRKGNITGGSMYYIAQGLGWRHAGAAVAILLFIQNCGATLIQSNTIAQVMKEAFWLPVGVTAVFVAVLMFFIISGGFQRLIQISQRVVPLMAGIYLISGLIVLIVHIDAVPQMFQQVFAHAFTWQAGTGAAMGYTMKEAMRYGVARGLYSNEAGEGSAPVFHSSAQVDHSRTAGLLRHRGSLCRYLPHLQYDRYCHPADPGQWHQRQCGDADGDGFRFRTAGDALYHVFQPHPLCRDVDHEPMVFRPRQPDLLAERRVG